MITAGKILKEAREQRHGTIERISKQTKIKGKFLEALESCDWAILPNFAVAQGFARSYAQVVGANSTLVVALLRRDFPQHQHKRSTREITFKPRSIWTPKATVVTVVAITVLTLGAYLAREYILFSSPPLLELTEVAGNAKTLTIAGKTTPSAAVDVNGKPALVDSGGQFRIELDRSDLINSQVEVQAVSRTGKKSVIQKNIIN